MPSIVQAFHNFKELFLYIAWSDSFRWVVYSFEQSLNFMLHPPFMVVNAQVMGCELISQSGIVLAFSSGLYLRPEGPWVAVVPLVHPSSWEISQQAILLEVWPHSSLFSFTTFQVPFCRSFFWWFSWPSWLLFYMLDPRFLAMVSIAFACAFNQWYNPGR
jgi:hypothetical protein